MRKIDFKQLGLIILALSLSLWLIPQMASRLLSNHAWIQFNHLSLPDGFVANDFTKAQRLFENANKISHQNQSSWFGLGQVYALLSQSNQALASWGNSAIGVNALRDLGRGHLRDGNASLAMIYFQGMSVQSDSIPSESVLLMATACQHVLNNLTSLSLDQHTFCSNFFTENESGFILNGDFDTNTMWGWQGHDYFILKDSAEMLLSPAKDQPGSILALTGKDMGLHHGLLQQIALPPNSTFEFGAKVKVEAHGPMNAKLLYIGWQQDDAPQGNQAEIVLTDMDWTSIERTFHTPDKHVTLYNLYPVVLTGEGTVWIDDVYLRQISE